VANFTLLSPGAVVADMLARAVAALDRIADERGLNPAEVRERQCLDAARAEAVRTAVLSGPTFVLGPAEPFFAACVAAGKAARGAVPLPELLDIEDAIPPTPEGLTWLGATMLAVSLELICAAGVSTPRRQEQLAAVRTLHGAAGRSACFQAQAASSSDQAERTRRRMIAALAAADDKLGGELAAIHAEAAALRV
jgi:hypothetical protein